MDSLKNNYLIRYESIEICYRNHLVLNNISGVLLPGTLTAIVGPNGGGKSTFLKVLMGLTPLQKGKVHLNNITYRDIAYLPQNNLIDRTFPISVFDFIASGHISHRGLFQHFTEHHQELTHHAIEMLGLKDYISKSISMLSGGQFQRCLFARLSLQNCNILLLDEPFTAIDMYTTEILQNLISQWHREGKTIMTVCHDIDIVKEFYPESILIAGSIISTGATPHVLTPQNWEIAKQKSQYAEQH